MKENKKPRKILRIKGSNKSKRAKSPCSLRSTSFTRDISGDHHRAGSASPFNSKNQPRYHCNSRVEEELRNFNKILLKRTDKAEKDANSARKLLK